MPGSAKKAYFQNNVKLNTFMHETHPSIVKQAKREDAVIFWGDETGINITPAVKYRSFYLSKFPSAALSSIVAALAATHTCALQMKIYPA